MASNTFILNIAEFVTNNYAAILENTGDVEFHMIQDFLRVSEVGFALTNPPMVSGIQVL